MWHLLLIIGLSGVITAATLVGKIASLFFKIDAKIKERSYMGLLKEWINIDYPKWFKGYYIDIFPFSFLLHKLNGERYTVFTEEVQQMFRKKFKYEIYFWSLFLFGLLLIPVSTFID